MALAHGFSLWSDGRVEKLGPDGALIRAKTGGNARRAAEKIGLLPQYEAALFAFNRK